MYLVFTRGARKPFCQRKQNFEKKQLFFEKVLQNCFNKIVISFRDCFQKKFIVMTKKKKKSSLSFRTQFYQIVSSLQKHQKTVSEYVNTFSHHLCMVHLKTRCGRPVDHAPWVKNSWP